MSDQSLEQASGQDALESDASSKEPWTCANCGTQNRASWRVCTSCEVTREGQVRLAGPARAERAYRVHHVLLGLVIVGAFVALLVVFGEDILEWLEDAYDAVRGWVDGQLSKPSPY